MPSATAATAANGWVKERFLRQRRYLPQITVGTEAADVIAVSISLTTFQESLNDYVTADEEIELELVLYDNNGVESVVGAFHIGATIGSEYSTTEQPRLIGGSTSGGAMIVDITDVVGGSGSTIHLIVRPLNVPGFPGYASITFD